MLIMIKITDFDLRALNWAGWIITYNTDNPNIITLEYTTDDKLTIDDDVDADIYLKFIRAEYTEFYKKKNKVYTLIDNFAKIKPLKRSKKMTQLPVNNTSFLTFCVELENNEK